MVSEGGFAVRLLDLVGCRVALELKDLIGVDDWGLWIHVVFYVGHDELCLCIVWCKMLFGFSVVEKGTRLGDSIPGNATLDMERAPDGMSCSGSGGPTFRGCPCSTWKRQLPQWTTDQ